jgi:hypothetical protein
MEGIDAKGGSQDGVIGANLVWNVVRLGIYVDSFGCEHNIAVRRNIVHDCQSGIIVSSEHGEPIEDVTIENNLLYHNRISGINISTFSKDGPRRNITIVNNTIVANGVPGKRVGQGIWVMTANITGLVIRNNILSHNLGVQIKIRDESVKGLAIDHNLIYGGGRPDANDVSRRGGKPAKGPAFLEADPLFVDLEEGDYHLRPNSPAINAGSGKAAPANDLDGFPRPYGGGFDIGCYETHPRDAKRPLPQTPMP